MTTIHIYYIIVVRVYAAKLRSSLLRRRVFVVVIPNVCLLLLQALISFPVVVIFKLSGTVSSLWRTIFFLERRYLHSFSKYGSLRVTLSVEKNELDDTLPLRYGSLLR